MRQLVCENLSVETSSTNRVTDCLRKSLEGLNIPRRRVCEYQSSGTNSLIKWQIGWRKYSIGTSFPDKETACLKIYFCLSYFCLIWTQLSIKKTWINGKETSKMHSHCSHWGVEVKNIGMTSCTIAFISEYISWSNGTNHWTTISFLIIGKDKKPD